MPELHAPIRDVTVFASGATVVRVAEVVAEGGNLPTEVEIPLLPLALIDPTVVVQVEQVEGDGKVWASQVRVGLYARPPSAAPEPPPDEELKAKRRALAAVERGLARLDQEVSLLSSIVVPDRPRGEKGKPPPASPMAARVALEQFSDEAVGTRVAEGRELREQKRLLEREVAHLEDRKNSASTARQVKPGELTKTVIARLEQAGSVEKARLAVSYHLPGARWAPSYQVRLSQDSSTADLSMRALVSQNTGEDWRGVELKLSTAEPLRYTELPELTAIKIGRAQAAPPTKRGLRPPPVGAEALFADHDRDRHRCAELLPPSSSWAPPRLVLDQLAKPAPARPAMPANLGPRGGKAMASGAAEVTMPQAPPAPVGVPRPHARKARAAEQDMDLLLEEDEFGGMTHDDTAAYEAAVEEDEATGSWETVAGAAAPAPVSLDEVHEKSATYAAPAKKRSGRGQAATAEAVAFGALRLSSGTDAGGRGRLSAVRETEVYLETLMRAQLEVRIDVMSVVDSASRSAGRTAAMSLPPHAVDVGKASGSFDFVYDTEAAVDVASDLSWHSIPVTAREAQTKVLYVVVPREDPNVYRVATLQNPLAGPLLPGPAEVYVGGEYVLSAPLPTVPPQGEFRLGLGVEQAIKCARNTRFSEARSGEERVAMTELQHAIEVELINHLGRTVQCEVRERIPQPGPDAEVVVEEEAVEPPWEPWDQEPLGRVIEGGRRWSIELESHDKRELKAAYVVKIYAVNELVGGNRRER